MEVAEGAFPLPELLARGGKAAVATLLSRIEKDVLDEATAETLDTAFANPIGFTVGVTGPPGAGKSTLIDALIQQYRSAGQTVAVLAVDPSSKKTGGALLGDRVRMRTDPADTGVFIRSIAARQRLGGLASGIFPASVLLRALYSVVIVESVGVGQSETDIAGVADTIVLCIQPGSGDSLQFMKAGILEIPHIAVVTKADVGAPATRALADLRGALSLVVPAGETFEAQCIAVSSATGAGVIGLMTAISTHRDWLMTGDRLAFARAAQARAWIESEVTAGFGSHGLRAAAPAITEGGQFRRPFAASRRILNGLSIYYSAPASSCGC